MGRNQRIQELTMVQKSKAFDILFELGEARRNRENWPDYKQCGVGRDDIDDLVNLVTDEALHGASAEGNEVWVPLHAWRALGQLADPRAIEPLIGTFDSLWEDDWALAELPVVVAMLGRDGIRPLTEFLNDRIHAEFARAMAVDALEGIAEREPFIRDQVVTIITEYLARPDENAQGLNGCAVNTLITLKATESIDTLRRLYESGNVDLSACGDIEQVEIELGLRTVRSTPAPTFREIYGLPAQQKAKREKVGRNDPCPCGSGKKYKKCCLQ